MIVRVAYSAGPFFSSSNSIAISAGNSSSATKSNSPIAFSVVHRARKQFNVSCRRLSSCSSRHSTAMIR